MADRGYKCSDLLHFWVGEIANTHRGRNKQVNMLTVRWYGTMSGKEVFYSVYKQLNLTVSCTTKDWIDTIWNDSIKISFSGLKKSKNLTPQVACHPRKVK